ncbi:hypothetical protein DU475_15740 [Rhodopseudomonas sp. WA056]|nr:hypothetical protein [Rhodopseudomonas sp. WA056]
MKIEILFGRHDSKPRKLIASFVLRNVAVGSDDKPISHLGIIAGRQTPYHVALADAFIIANS